MLAYTLGSKGVISFNFNDSDDETKTQWTMQVSNQQGAT